jgi:hypothetical protein
MRARGNASIMPCLRNRSLWLLARARKASKIMRKAILTIEEVNNGYFITSDDPIAGTLCPVHNVAETKEALLEIVQSVITDREEKRAK